MKCLLLGNGELNGTPLPAADLVVQFNLCRHRDLVPPEASRMIFISNTGEPALGAADFLEREGEHPALHGASIICARNPVYYGLKRRYLRMRQNPLWIDYELFPVIRRLKAQAVGWRFSWKLDRELFRLGMPVGQMPSTGLIAQRWLSRWPNMEFSLRGFSWEGWAGHPWEIERQLLGKLK